MRYVALSAGHGGLDVGACHNGVVESVYTMGLSYATEHELALRGVGVVQCRVGNVDPSHAERAATAREHQCEGVIVIHVNAAKPGSRGPMAFHLGVDVRAIDAAREFIRRVGLPGWYEDEIGRVKPMQSQVWVAKPSPRWLADAWSCMRQHTEPVFLAEVGFCSNGPDAQRLKSAEGIGTLAAALADAALVMVG